jgi:hypothetical protein
MANLYANENFPLDVVKALRALGHDVLTSHDAGNANQSIPDETVLKLAAGGKRALLTINRRDFIREHDLQPGHAGIIVCTQDPDANGQAQRIDDAIRLYKSLDGLLIRVNRPQE